MPTVIYLVNLEVLEKEGPLRSIPVPPVYSNLELARKALEEQAGWVTNKIIRFTVNAQIMDPQSLRFIEKDPLPPPVISGYICESKVHYWEEPKKTNPFEYTVEKQASNLNFDLTGDNKKWNSVFSASSNNNWINNNSNNNTQPQSRYGCTFQGCQGCIECRPRNMFQ